MRNLLSENKEFNILSRSVDNAATCKVIDINEDCFKVKLNQTLKYEQGESVELFSMTAKGQVYFETLVKEVEDDILSIWFPLSYKLLQRREYTRINVDTEVELMLDDEILKAEILDLSAGGLRVYTTVPLKLVTEYKIKLPVDNKILNLNFQPNRIEYCDNGFIASGRYINISNTDRVVLVQYCLRKYIENSIK